MTRTHALGSTSRAGTTNAATPRRRRLAVAAFVAAAALLASCTDAPVDGSDTGDAVGEPASSGEAPMLAERVEAGELPPVEERLPGEPLVVEPTDQVGQYGGTWRTALTGPGDEVWANKTIGYEGLVRWSPEWSGAPGYEEILPNVASSFEVSDDGREFSFTLREGMRWSDGEPFTMDDIEFAYNEVWADEGLASAAGVNRTVFLQDGEVAAFRVDDETTFTLSFAQPNGVFLTALASTTSLIAPLHYLEQFHPAYNDDVDALVESESYSTWQDLFAAKMNYITNPELPVLHPWVVTEPLGTGNAVVAERNPYYFKVDPAENQLPYIDTVRYSVMNEPEVMLAAAMQGEIDMHVRHFIEPVNKPVLAGAREEGNFDFFELEPALANEMVVMLNLTHEDPVMREMFTNIDFRIGLSYAINRGELVNSVYQRQGTPSQVAPQPNSPFYDEALSTQYTEFDVELANQHLDDAGYSERDAEGRRLDPDGEPITFSVEYSGEQAGFDDALSLISQNWAEVGITMTPDPMDRSLFEQRRLANGADAVVWLAGGGTDVTQNPFWYVPVSTRSDYAQLWAQWYLTGGAEGEEPPEEVQNQMDLYDELARSPEADDQQALMEEILRIATEQFYHIGTVLPGPGYGIVSNDFHNVPESMADSYRVQFPAHTNPEQYFIAQQ